MRVQPEWTAHQRLPGGRGVNQPSPLEPIRTHTALPSPPSSQDTPCCPRVGTAPWGRGRGSLQRNRGQRSVARWSAPFPDPRPLAAGSSKPRSSRVWQRICNGEGLHGMKCFPPNFMWTPWPPELRMVFKNMIEPNRVIREGPNPACVLSP